MANENHWPPLHGVPSPDSFKDPERLEWGETPFDTLSRGELLRLVQAYHSALSSVSGALSMFKVGLETDNPFWSASGTGGRALAKAKSVMKLAGTDKTGEGSERIFRCFFRYADILLFPDVPEDIYLWAINEERGEMVAPYRGQPGFRPIEWRDLVPKAKEPERAKAIADAAASPNRYPRRSNSEIRDNLRSLAASISICRLPAKTPLKDAWKFFVEEAEQLVLLIYYAPESEWRNWMDDPPTAEHGPVAARDALGFIHLATHLVGGNDGMWAEQWLPIPFSKV